VINFLEVDWELKHFTFGLIEAINILGKLLAKSLIKLLKKKL
jgi:hypothetical protein